jgi:hypothetical protein
MNTVLKNNNRAGKALFVTDFDGTLVQSDGTVAKKDSEALEKLGELGVVRAIATDGPFTLSTKRPDTPFRSITLFFLRGSA